MKNEKLVSIIIPVYNVEKFIRKCLDSVLAQDYSNIEILCVDDCSPDNSAKIILEYQKKYSNIFYYTYEKNGGLGYARDYGMSIAKGDYILFVDSDDYINTDHVSTYVNAIDEDTDIIMGSYNRDINGKITPIKIKKSKYSAWIYPSAWIRMYRRKFLVDNSLNFRGIRTYEDGFFNERCMLKKPNVKIIEYRGYNYVLNPNSITKKTSDAFEKYKRYVENYFELWEEVKEVVYSLEDYSILEYLYVQGITINMLYNLRRTGLANINEFYNMRKDILSKCFPNYKKNKWIGLNSLKEEMLKNRVAIWIYITLEKLKMEKILLFFIAL